MLSQIKVEAFKKYRIMIDKKKTYLKPSIEVEYMDIEQISIICVSGAPALNNTFMEEDFTEEPEVDAGGEEW